MFIGNQLGVWKGFFYFFLVPNGLQKEDIVVHPHAIGLAFTLLYYYYLFGAMNLQGGIFLFTSDIRVTCDEWEFVYSFNRPKG